MRTSRLSCLALAAAALSAPAYAQTATLTGFTTWGANDSSGAWTGGFWDTITGGGWNAYFFDPNTLVPLTSGDTAATLTPSVSIPSNLLFATAAEADYPFLGINLYFDGSATPGISAVYDVGTGLFGAIAPTTSTYGLSGGVEPGAGSLSHAGVTLNAWSYIQVNHNGFLDMAGPVDSVPDGAIGDNVAQLGFSGSGGSAAPEPAPLGLLLLGLPLACRGLRRR